MLNSEVHTYFFPLRVMFHTFKGLVLCLFLFSLHSASEVALYDSWVYVPLFKILWILSSWKGSCILLFTSASEPSSSKSGSLSSAFVSTLGRTKAKGKCGVPWSKSRKKNVNKGTKTESLSFPLLPISTSWCFLIYHLILF